MGNTIKHAADYLRDPYLVRRIQETFGVREIVIPQASETVPSSANKSTAKENGRVETNGGLMNGGLEWLTSVKVRRRLKRSMSISPCESISSSPSTSDSETPEFPSNIVIESVSLLDIYFRFATELGYEPFYITFLPSIFWNFDSQIARHVVILWCISMYVGQACKAVFKWRRPSSPPVFRLEDNPKIETEYGFPSTHAIVSTIIPFYFLYSFVSRYEVRRQWSVGGSLFFEWDKYVAHLCTLTCSVPLVAGSAHSSHMVVLSVLQPHLPRGTHSLGTDNPSITCHDMCAVRIWNA